MNWEPCGRLTIASNKRTHDITSNPNNVLTICIMYLLFVYVLLFELNVIARTTLFSMYRIDDE